MNWDSWQLQFEEFLLGLLDWVSSPVFYSELTIVAGALLAAYTFSIALKKHTQIFRTEPTSGHAIALRKKLFGLGSLIFPLFSIVALSIALGMSEMLFEDVALVRAAQGLAILIMLYSVVTKYINQPLIKLVFRWGLLPIVALHIFGVLDDVSSLLDLVHVEIGNIRISANGVLRVVIFGSLLFWFGRASNNLGKQLIRAQESLDLGTREVFAKLFEVGLYLCVFILLLQVMGVNLTALAVFGGALGVGLGIGLQAIASNFISGVIILLDRSIAVGDFIELEDGRVGTIRELNMRSTLLETFDGKDIMVPNEQFITSSFVNWTHKDKRQRYSLNFSVAYKTDISAMVPLIREAVAGHPKVLSGSDLPFEFQPDCEICGFGDSGVEMLVEWWMEGIDDGENRVGGDLLLTIFELLREHKIEIPFPQREVKILGEAAEKDGVSS
jgi:small-conductance mechanosensitive channel